MSDSIRSVFLSHNSEDKPFVRKIGKILELHGINVWIDEAEIKLGESLIYKISEALDEVECLFAFVSSNSINSNWVKKELSMAMTMEINQKLRVIPIIINHCKIPNFLVDKKYVDFSDVRQFEKNIRQLVNSLGYVFNNTVFNDRLKSNTLYSGIDRALEKGYFVLTQPFYRPFQYVGLKIQELSKRLNVEPNEANNIVLESDLARLYLESEGQFVAYVEVDLKQTEPHKIDQEFDSEILLSCLSINPSELELIRKKTHHHTYYDHARKLKVGVFCSTDDGPISIGISTKYYGE